LKLLQPIKDKYSGVTYADLFQLAGATAVEVLLVLFWLQDWPLFIWTYWMVHLSLFEFQEAGGPKLPMKYGRVDVSGPEQCPEEGRLPGNNHTFCGSLIVIENYI